jgi:hypothetical protein
VRLFFAASAESYRSKTPPRPAISSSSTMRSGVPTSFSRPPWRLTVMWAAMISPSRVLSM